MLALALAAATAVAVGERPRGLGEALLRAGDLLRLVRVAGMGNCGSFARRMFVANNVGIQNGARSACGLLNRYNCYLVRRTCRCCHVMATAMAYGVQLC